MAASDSDIWDLLKLLPSPSDIPRLYAELGMNVHQVQKFEDEAGSGYTSDIKARKVLFLWRRGLENQEEGSRQVFLEAIARCRLFDVYRQLKKQWNIIGKE